MRGLMTRIGISAQRRMRGEPDPPVSDLGREHTETDSIRLHLQALLNCTRGDSQSAPEYGVPDLTDLLRDVPDSIATLRRMLQKTIEEFEPRVHRVRVRFVSSDLLEDPTRLRFEISARLVQRPGTEIRMTTRIRPGGQVFVESYGTA